MHPFNILLVDFHTTKNPLDGKNAMKCYTFCPPSKTPYFYVHWGHHLSFMYLVQYILIIYMFFLLDLGIQ
jgi:hypothetical protein